jgi:hypothetical protein
MYQITKKYDFSDDKYFKWVFIKSFGEKYYDLAFKS